MDADDILKVKIIPPSVHNTLEADDKNMEKDKPTKEYNDNEKKSKEKSPQPRSPNKEAPQKSSIAPEEEYQFDPEGRSAISGQKRTGWL